MNAFKKPYEYLKPGGRFGFTTVEKVTGYLREVSAFQFNNSYDEFLSTVGLAFRPLSKTELLTDFWPADAFWL